MHAELGMRHGAVAGEGAPLRFELSWIIIARGCSAIFCGTEYDKVLSRHTQAVDVVILAYGVMAMPALASADQLPTAGEAAAFCEPGNAGVGADRAG